MTNVFLLIGLSLIFPSANAANCRCIWTPENITDLCPGQSLDVGLNCTACDAILDQWNNGSIAAYNAELGYCKAALKILHPGCIAAEFGPVTMWDGIFLKLETCTDSAAVLGAGAIAGIAVGGVLVLVQPVQMALSHQAVGVVISSMKAAKAATANKYGTLADGDGQNYGT